MNVESVTFNPGQLYRRRDLHQQFGGQRQGGISTPKRAPLIFLITGDSGKQHGYRDEWTDDGLFSYTGKGQYGDMKFTEGNRAIRDHVKNGESLQVFEQDKKDKRFLRFLGEMEYVTHLFREALDTAGKKRQAIIFQLRPTGILVPDSAVVAAALDTEVSTDNRRGGGFGSVETNRRTEKAAVEFVKQSYEQNGWTVTSVEVQKLGYDLRCVKDGISEHVEVKGTQGADICFIITAAEVRNAMLDRRHVTCIVTSVLTSSPCMVTFSKEEFTSKFQLDPIAFRARLRT